MHSLLDGFVSHGVQCHLGNGFLVLCRVPLGSQSADKFCSCCFNAILGIKFKVLQYGTACESTRYVFILDGSSCKVKICQNVPVCTTQEK